LERLLHEGKQGSSTEIPHALPPPNFLISFLPAPQLNVTRTIWRGLKNVEARNKTKKKFG